MQCALNLGLPRQCVHDTVEMQCGLSARENCSLGIGELQVRHERHGVSHGDDAFLHLDPVPGDPSGQVRRGNAPDRLSARVVTVTQVENPGAKMHEMEFRSAFSLPQ